MLQRIEEDGRSLLNSPCQMLEIDDDDAYYGLVLKAAVKATESILVHGGHSSMGQAFLAVAIQLELVPYTTVTNTQQKEFIRTRFPQILESNIYKIHDKQLPMNIMKETEAKGIDIIIRTPNRTGVPNPDSPDEIRTCGNPTRGGFNEEESSQKDVEISPNALEDDEQYHGFEVNYDPMLDIGEKQAHQGATGTESKMLME
uniref:Uncharacterized protein n=1 Tax=Timema cristinae TaxID=61476 RepID=A0A7R9CS34_TIMCR|nr:unnamed protein product [Timema cristinae]